jgi:hypothetical protein
MNGPALFVQAGEGLWAGVFIHQMKVGIQQDVLVIETPHRMGVDKFLVQGPR